MLTYKILGCGGVCPRANTGLASIYVQCGRTSILIDCGESSQLFAAKINLSLFNLNAIFITHLHADHVLGIPGLLSSLTNNGRKAPLVIYGPPGTESMLMSMLGTIATLSFRVYAVEISDQTSIDLLSLHVDVAALQHSTVCYGYAISAVRQPMYRQDVVESTGLSQAAISLLQAGCNIEYDGLQLDINTVFGTNRENVKLVYATDTGVCESLKRLCKDANIVVLDGSYGSDAQRPKTDTSAVHMSFAEAATVAKEAGVKKLILTHFAPLTISPWIYLEETREIFANTVCAYPGMSGTLTFDREISDEEGLPVIETTSNNLRGIIFRGFGLLHVSTPLPQGVDRCVLTAPRFAAIVRVVDSVAVHNGKACKDVNEPGAKISLYVEFLQCIRWMKKEVAS